MQNDSFRGPFFKAGERVMLEGHPNAIITNSKLIWGNKRGSYFYKINSGTMWWPEHAFKKRLEIRNS